MMAMMNGFRLFSNYIHRIHILCVNQNDYIRHGHFTLFYITVISLTSLNFNYNSTCAQLPQYTDGVSGTQTQCRLTQSTDGVSGTQTPCRLNQGAVEFNMSNYNGVHSHIYSFSRVYTYNRLFQCSKKLEPT